MKVLIVSQGAWDDSTSFGNTFSNLFDNNEYKIAHIYTNNGTPNSKIKASFCNINEKLVFKSILKKQENVIYPNKKNNMSSVNTRNNYFLYNVKNIVRELFWFFSKINYQKVYKFIDDFKPDLVFMTASQFRYINVIERNIALYTKKPCFIYTSDDAFSFRQYSFNVLFWLRRLVSRIEFTKTVKKCNALFVISNEQKNEYQKLFKKKCYILQKWKKFQNYKIFNFQNSDQLVMTFTGNMNLGRWKSLLGLGVYSDKINKLGYKRKIVLNYYCNNIPKFLKKKFGKVKCLEKFESIHYSEVKNVQLNSDVLIHCESFNIIDSSKVRLSFSTKIVDYLSTGKCIFAIGNKNCSSIKYFAQNDCGIIAINKKDIYNQLLKIINDEHLISKYAYKGYEIGNNNHSKDIKQQEFFDILSNYL